MGHPMPALEVIKALIVRAPAVLSCCLQCRNREQRRARCPGREGRKVPELSLRHGGEQASGLGARQTWPGVPCCSSTRTLEPGVPRFRAPIHARPRAPGSGLAAVRVPVRLREPGCGDPVCARAWGSVLSPRKWGWAQGGQEGGLVDDTRGLGPLCLGSGADRPVRLPGVPAPDTQAWAARGKGR